MQSSSVTGEVCETCQPITCLGYYLLLQRVVGSVLQPKVHWPKSRQILVASCFLRSITSIQLTVRDRKWRLYGLTEWRCWAWRWLCLPLELVQLTISISSGPRNLKVLFLSFVLIFDRIYTTSLQVYYFEINFILIRKLILWYALNSERCI